MPAAVSPSEIARVFREEYGRAVSVLVRSFGDIDLAEEMVQEAFTAAVERWPTAGKPPSPAGWIIATARNRAIDHLRREGARAQRRAHGAAALAGDDQDAAGAADSETPTAEEDQETSASAVT